MTEPLIMLIDDEVAFVETLAKRLSSRSFKILKAFSAEEGLEKLKTNPDIDVIVLDIKMPGMDGITALKEIKTISPLVEILMLTGHATIESAIGAMKLGASDFLMKPFDIDELIFKMNDAAGKKRAHERKIKDAFKQETLAKYGPFYYT